MTAIAIITSSSVNAAESYREVRGVDGFDMFLNNFSTRKFISTHLLCLSILVVDRDTTKERRKMKTYDIVVIIGKMQNSLIHIPLPTHPYPALIIRIFTLRPRPDL